MIRAFLLILLFSFLAYAEKQKPPVVIEADKLTYLKKKNEAIYTGNVVVKKGDFTLFADKMYVFFKQNSKDKKSKIDKIIAIGNVHFTKGVYKGKAEKLEYYEDKKIIKLIGNAVLEKEGNIIEGDVIVYNLFTEEAKVSGNKRRVKTIIIQ